MPSVNRRLVLSAVGVDAQFTLVAVPSGPSASIRPVPGDGGDTSLVFNDCVDLPSANSGSEIWRCPLVSLAGIAGMVIDLGVTSTGLTVSACPPGVAAQVDFG
jgi:hypothetical protein